MPRPIVACPVALALSLAVSAAWATGDARPASRAAKVASQATTRAADTVWHGTQEVALYALGLIGVSYRWGGDSPDAGLDCSGLVRHVFREVAGVALPRTSKELSRVGASVAKNDLVPGDLVFFDTRRFAFSHVGIYLGENRFVHAPRRGGAVEIAELDNGYWRKRFNGARRLVGVLPSLVRTLVPAAHAAPARDAVDTASTGN